MFPYLNERTEEDPENTLNLDEDYGQTGLSPESGT
jgi:hypothetical protein